MFGSKKGGYCCGPDVSHMLFGAETGLMGWYLHIEGQNRYEDLMVLLESYVFDFSLRVTCMNES